jgi:hypothetical protein
MFACSAAIVMTPHTSTTGDCAKAGIREMSIYYVDAGRVGQLNAPDVLSRGGGLYPMGFRACLRRPVGLQLEPCNTNDVDSQVRNPTPPSPPRRPLSNAAS